jgi:hypothetical protein
VPAGRPTDYNIELAERICDAIAVNVDFSLEQVIEANPGFPSRDTIYKWRYKHKEFADMYVSAKQHQAELLAEQIVEIAKDDSEDMYVDAEGRKAANAARIARHRLIVDTQKWVACKLAPRLYGDKTEHTHTIKYSDLIKELGKNDNGN